MGRRLRFAICTVLCVCSLCSLTLEPFCFRFMETAALERIRKNRFSVSMVEKVHSWKDNWGKRFFSDDIGTVCEHVEAESMDAIEESVDL